MHKHQSLTVENHRPMETRRKKNEDRERERSFTRSKKSTVSRHDPLRFANVTRKQYSATIVYPKDLDPLLFFFLSPFV